MINMPIEFETKKVPMETLGEYLSEVRKQLNLTLEEVAQKTGVYEKFIHYIEESRYQKLPPDVYVLGFLKKLADVYKVSSDALIDQYKKERGIVEHKSRQAAPVTSGLGAKLRNITVTPKLLTISSSIAVGVFAFFYIVFQVFAINKTPSLTIVEPKPDSVVQGSSINVSGKTEPGITVSLNGQNIFVNSDGGFQTMIGVAPGQKELKIEAQNKFGKKNTQMIAIRVEEQSPSVAGAQTEEPSGLKLELSFSKKVTLAITRDGQQLGEEEVAAGSTKSIIAQREIIVTTSDAGNTNAVFNGKNIGVLGETGQPITVPFTKEASELLESMPQPIPTPSPSPRPKVTPKPVVSPKIAPSPKPSLIPTPAVVTPASR